MKKAFLTLAMFGVLAAGSFQLVAASSNSEASCLDWCRSELNECMEWGSKTLCFRVFNACMDECNF